MKNLIKFVEALTDFILVLAVAECLMHFAAI